MKFLSQVYAAVSGSVGGVTYSHNRGGMYTRTRAIPTNPNTIRQQTTRAYLGNAVQAWNQLSEGQRQAWRNYADGVPLLDKLGQMQKRTGQQMYVRSYVSLMKANGDPAPDAAPTIMNTGANPTGTAGSGTGDPNVLGVDTVTQTLSTDLILASETDSTGFAMLFIGQNVNPGVTFYKGPYQLAAVSAVPDVETTIAFDQLQAALLNDNGPLVVDTRRPVRFRIAYTDGRVSQDFAAILPIQEQSE